MIEGANFHQEVPYVCKFDIIEQQFSGNVTFIDPNHLECHIETATLDKVSIGAHTLLLGIKENE